MQGIEVPRKSQSGKDLPSPRKVSLDIFEDIPRPSGVHTVMHMTFGQLLDHDLDKTAVSKLIKPDSMFNIFTQKYVSNLMLA